MSSLLPTLAVLLTTFTSAVLGQATENITISPLPTFSTCQLAIISWTGGKAPYRGYIYPADWTNQTDWIVELPLTTRQQTSWNVNLDAGSGIVVNVWDGVNDAYSEPVWIQDSGDSSCLGFNGTMQSSVISLANVTLPTSMSVPSRSPAVVSTPSSAPTPPPTQPSGPASSSAAPAPQETVTVSVPNASLPTWYLQDTWALLAISMAVGLLSRV